MGGDDDGSLLIIMACMAKYCSYWRRMKSPIDGNIIADVSRRVGRLGEEWKTLWMGWKYYSTCTYTTITSVMTRIDDDDTNVGWATLH